MERLEREFLPLPNVGNVAGLGLELSIEIVADKETKRRFPAEMNICDVIQRRCRGKGLFARALSGLSDVDMVIVIPPLIITSEEADKELDMLYPVIAGLKELKVK
jgi:L-2,4-diaminobutyrate transaminase